ncbi:hypothetical protein L0F63_000686, partial [Massospora cicadina]
EFPEQFRTSLSGLLPRAHVNLAVYPKFETRGSLSLATENFCAWLKGIEAQRRTQPGGELPLLTILMGHSMGGLLAGDAYLKYRHECKGSLNGFPHILGATSFGTQLKGVATGLGLAGLARSASTSTPAKANNFRTLALGGLAVAAAATGAYLCRDRIQTLYSYAMDHLDFVNALGKPEELITGSGHWSIAPRLFSSASTCKLIVSRPEGKSCFIKLPGEENGPMIGADRFLCIESGAHDEINAHTTMFDPSENVCYLQMTKQAVALTYRAIRQFQANSAP